MRSLPGCFQYDVDYLEHDVSTVGNVANERECQDLCKKHDGCKFFGYVLPPHPAEGYRKLCFLKSRRDVVKKMYHVVSGPKHCP